MNTLFLYKYKYFQLYYNMKFNYRYYYYFVKKNKSFKTSIVIDNIIYHKNYIILHKIIRRIYLFELYFKGKEITPINRNLFNTIKRRLQIYQPKKRKKINK